MLYSYREAALNWLAFGLLLAAWNAADDHAVEDKVAEDKVAIRAASGVARHVPPRPAALRAYARVTVRAMRVVEGA